MSFKPVCCCPFHSEWGFGSVSAPGLTLRPADYFHKKYCGITNSLNKSRNRKICTECGDKIDLEKSEKPAKNPKYDHTDAAPTEPQAVEISGKESSAVQLTEHEQLVDQELFSFPSTSYDNQPTPAGSIYASDTDKADKESQTVLGDWPKIAYQDLRSERTKKTKQNVVADLVSHVTNKLTHGDEVETTKLVKDIQQSKTWTQCFGRVENDKPQLQLPNANTFLLNLVSEYKDCKDSITNNIIRKKGSKIFQKINIGSSKASCNIPLSAGKQNEYYSSRTAMAKEVGRLRIYGDERRRLLSIVAWDFSYSELCTLFSCSTKTVTAARVHALLFGRGGVQSDKLKFSRQTVSDETLHDLTEFLYRDDISRASSCRSVVINKEETAVRYWKDTIKAVINQYLVEFPNGVKRTYIYTHLPRNFRTDTMLAGLCNLCDEFNHHNFSDLQDLVRTVCSSTVSSVISNDTFNLINSYQKYLKTMFTNQMSYHSTCQELCLSFALGECELPHTHNNSDITEIYKVVSQIQFAISGLLDANIKSDCSKRMDTIIGNHTLLLAHMARTKYQSEYYRFTLKNLKPGQAVIIVDYKMKIELVKRLREPQREWFGKRGVSLHGCLVVWCGEDGVKHQDIMDLWSEDSKQDAWFTQSAFDVIFKWLENKCPGYQLYLFSDNGPHYHNSGVLLYLAQVNSVFNLQLVEYNFFEAGEGKTQLDSHFAHISHKIIRWVRIGHDLESGEQLGELIKDFQHVTCCKLVVDRSKATSPGTLKDISLYGSFTFPRDGEQKGGIIGRSVASAGKTMKKTEAELKKLAKSSGTIAGATGATILEENVFDNFVNTECNGEESGYAVKYIQHAKEQHPNVQLTVQVSDSYSLFQPESAYAIKTNLGKRTVFTLEQKEIMMSFYDNQETCSVRADPRAVIQMMTERGIPVLNERQIKSWWSSYHQKKKKQMQELANLASQMQGSVRGNNPSPSSSHGPASSSSSGISNSDTAPTSSQQDAHNSQNLPVNSSSTSSPANCHDDLSDPTSNTISDGPVNTSTVSPNTVSPPLVLPILRNDGVVTQWIYPRDFSQSTLYGRDGSNACTLIALHFGHLHHKYKLVLSVHSADVGNWTKYLETAICVGNDVHDELFDMGAVNLSCEEAIAVAGENCCVDTVGEILSCFGDDCIEQLTRVFVQAAEQARLNRKDGYYILIVPGYTMLVIMQSSEWLILVDSHVHTPNGAMLASVAPNQHHAFFQWFEGMIYRHFNVSLRACNITPVSYV